MEKQDSKLSTEPAGSYPVVKPDVAAITAAELTPAVEAKPTFVFRMNGGSLNPEINGKRVNIRPEKVGVEQVTVGGGVGWVDVYRYTTTNPDVAKWLRDNGYQELKKATKKAK